MNFTCVSTDITAFVIYDRYDFCSSVVFKHKLLISVRVDTMRN